MEESTNITSPSLSANNDSRLMPVENLIHIVRGEQVMLDSDLAKLYGVETRVLNQAVKRNIERFPLDFMFQLNKDEAENLKVQIATTSSRSQNVILKDNLGDLKSQNLTSNPRSQNATLKQGHNIKYLPYAFTENGVAMLSSVLRSKTAIEVNIRIMRAFTAMRSFLMSNAHIFQRLETVEHNYLLVNRHLSEHDRKFEEILSRLDDKEAFDWFGFFVIKTR